MTPSRDDLVWMAPSIAAGVVVYLIYLWTNPYPAHGAGLYLTMAREVSEHGYALPRTIPYYTRGGIPFAYPPLGIYAVALVRDVTGLGPLAISRWLPGPIVVASLVPTYYLARELLDSRPEAALAATLVAVNPQLLDWHLTAGGIVRAPAFLFTTSGLYAGVRLFGPGARCRSWLGLAVACFGLTVLIHPTYALFFGVSYLVLYGVLDRSMGGFAAGVIVAVGGVALAAPWWLTVVRFHGFDVFLGAMGTHGGMVGGVVARLVRAPLDPVVTLLVVVLALVVPAGIVVGRSALAAWLVVVSLVFSQPRFTLLVGTFLVVGVLLAVVPPERAVGALDEFAPASPSIGRTGPALVLAVAVVLAGLTGVWYVRDDTAAPRVTITPDSVDGEALEAMEWARSRTAPGASFVVLGDASEWFPFFADRTLLVSPWGAEWEGSRTYARHLSLYWTVSWCDTERCLTAALDRHGVRPDYVYVPTAPYHVQGTPRPGAAGLAGRLERSDRFVLVFENEGVAVFRTTDRLHRSARERARPTAWDHLNHGDRRQTALSSVPNRGSVATDSFPRGDT